MERKTIILKLNKYYEKIRFIICLIMILIITTGHKWSIIDNYGLSFELKLKHYQTKKFCIIQRIACMSCGLFSQYIVHLGCINKYLRDGYIPIVDFKTRKNKYNDMNTSLNNPWELFFNQIFNYTLDEVIKYAKNVKYLICSSRFPRPNEMIIYYDRNTINFWKNIASKYMPIKKKIIDEVNIIKSKLFGTSQNILGVKLRGTDYKKKPIGHSIQPKIEKVIIDVKKADFKYNYDFIFFATEDESIKKQFVPEFKNKIKMLNPDDKDYMLNFKEKSYQHLNYIKNYIFNILILSKCLDIISSRCSGAVGVFLLSSGFRNSIIYNLGKYI